MIGAFSSCPPKCVCENDMEAQRFPSGKKMKDYSSRLFAFRILNVARDPAEESVDEEAKDEKRDEVRKTGHMILVSPSRYGV